MSELMSGPAQNAVTAFDRQTRMLRTAMGPAIARALEDPQVIEVMLNPDGALWVDRLGEGRSFTGLKVSPRDAERIIRLVAAHVRIEVHAGAPIVSAELPETGERFEGILPPVTKAPSFAIRKRAIKIISLAQYVADAFMTEDQALALRQAVRERRNIVIAGGTSTGKTTLANALLKEMASTGDRVLILEDTIELQSCCDDHVALRTKAGVVTLKDLVRSTLRFRPDRIVVGEVRGAEALDLLKAWATGHPGGVATLHASSARGALTRLEQLIQEAVVTVSPALIAEAVDVVVFLSRHGRASHLPSSFASSGWRPMAIGWSRYALIRNERRSPVANKRFYRNAQKRIAALAALAFYSFVAAPAHAAGSNMPWEGPLQAILDSIQGPVVRIVAVIVIAITGLTLAFGDSSGGLRRLIQVVFGLSIAFAATSFFLTFFGFSGGATVA